MFYDSLRARSRYVSHTAVHRLPYNGSQVPVAPQYPLPENIKHSYSHILPVSANFTVYDVNKIVIEIKYFLIRRHFFNYISEHLILFIYQK